MRKKAFTLIELLVVIAVIAVLMAILMPALHCAREQGKRIVCQSNLKQMSLAWIMYAQENDGKIMSGNPGTSPRAGSRVTGSRYAPTTLEGKQDLYDFQKLVWGKVGWTIQ